MAVCARSSASDATPGNGGLGTTHPEILFLQHVHPGHSNPTRGNEWRPPTQATVEDVTAGGQEQKGRF